jgi:hypothetical protein
MIALSELLADLARGLPNLPGARCKGRTGLYDMAAGCRPQHPADVQYARNAAARLCATYPALESCRAWHDALPPAERAGSRFVAPPRPRDHLNGKTTAAWDIPRGPARRTPPQRHPGAITPTSGLLMGGGVAARTRAVAATPPAP